MILLMIIILLILIGIIYRQIKESYLVNDLDIQRLKNKLLSTFPELNHIKLMKGSSSYTINKYKIYICLRDKKTRKLYTDNMLIYVILHELAHTICDEIGHTKKFLEIFQKLLIRAERVKLFNPSIPRDRNYCE